MWSLLCASEDLISPSGAKRQQCREQDKNRHAKAARGVLGGLHGPVN